MRKFQEEKESNAVSYFEVETGLSVCQSGIIVSTERPYLACSPDGLVDEDFLIEVKCPFSARNSEINPETVEYLYLDDQTGCLALHPEHQYYYQIQGQLYVANRKMCYFVFYTFREFAIIKVWRDDAFIASLICQLDAFFDAYFKPAVLRKFYYKVQQASS